MKQTLRNSLITCFRWLGLIELFKRRARKRGPLVRIVSFHDVRDHAWFAAVITMMKNEYRLLTVQDFEAENFSNDSINILLTFDDGYASWVDIVLPVLKEHNLEGLFFVSSGLLKAQKEDREEEFTEDRLLLRTKRNLLSFEGLKVLRDCGQVIGGHTKSHIRLAELSREEQQQEIQDDKQVLENFLGESLTHFAYPFGTGTDYTDKTTELAKEAGYEFIYTASSDWYTSDAQKNIPRLLLEEGQSLASVKDWLEGGYDILHHIKF